MGGLGIRRGGGGGDDRERGNLHTQRPLIIHFSKGGADREGRKERRPEQGSYPTREKGVKDSDLAELVVSYP